jgi:hypothetical protein
MPIGGVDTNLSPDADLSLSYFILKLIWCNKPDLHGAYYYSIWLQKPILCSLSPHDLKSPYVPSAPHDLKRQINICFYLKQIEKNLEILYVSISIAIQVKGKDAYKTLICLYGVQQYFSYIVAVSFIGGGNRRTQRKPPTCRKSQTNFIP